MAGATGTAGAADVAGAADATLAVVTSDTVKAGISINADSHSAVRSMAESAIDVTSNADSAHAIRPAGMPQRFIVRISHPAGSDRRRTERHPEFSNLFFWQSVILGEHG
jgi:hypothetical protein